MVISFFLLVVGTNASAEQMKGDKGKPSLQFEEVQEEHLSELEKAFIDLAKKQEGVFRYGSLYVISLGEQPNPGYGIKLEKQEQTLEQLQLFVKRTFPEEGKAYPEILSYPYIVGKVDLPRYTTLSVFDSETKKPLSKENQLTFMTKRVTEDSQKTWSISFNRPLTKKLLETFEISVMKFGENEKHPIDVKLYEKNKKKIEIKPLATYKNGLYLIHINNRLSRSQSVIPFEVNAKQDVLQLEYDFAENLNGWAGNFSDLPIKYDEKQYELDFGHKPIPLKGEKLRKGLLLSGMNRSDDLFMYAKKKIGKEEGLLPNQTYLLSMELEFYTNADPGLVGVGGSPGEAVYVKVGASTKEPKSIEVNTELRMNIDKGEQATSGKDAVVIGNVAKERETGEQYELKKLKMEEPITIKTNENGDLWTIFGTDSGFEGKTSLYYSKVKINMVKVEK